jgi:hypothetical protein
MHDLRSFCSWNVLSFPICLLVVACLGGKRVYEACGWSGAVRDSASQG